MKTSLKQFDTKSKKKKKEIEISNLKQTANTNLGQKALRVCSYIFMQNHNPS